ncbi:hypothetical protein [Oceanicoccus sp. KOV_DT_Chl]|uniref:hypothetical protein n=1 Tax=Oceanicoccus sp. KOV_DT_Chl TaxID=1904639 RepID=UPI001F36C18A|nr:hypothetical protein [Oceanicoccus sp. KOV_DT_Chl]
MSVPAVIEQVLTQHDIEFNVIDAHPSAQLQGTARSSVLQDSQGKLQAIYPAESILDVDALRAHTKRELKATSLEDVQTLCSSAQLSQLTNVPKALGLDIVIDQRLLECTELTLETGNEQHFVSLSAAQFKQLIGDALVANIAVTEAELQTTSLDSAADTDQITAAVANFTQLRIKQRLEETLEFPPCQTLRNGLSNCGLTPMPISKI